MDIEAHLIEAATFTQPGFYSTAIRTFSILSIILAVILIGFYLIKRFGPKGSGFMCNNRWIKVIAATYIAPKKMISLVEIAGEILVLGLTDNQITILTKVTNKQMIRNLKSSQEKKNTNSPFYQQFKCLISKCGSEGEKEETLLHKITSD